MGYYDNWGVWHNHSPAQFCQFHPDDFKCQMGFMDLGLTPTPDAIPPSLPSVPNTPSMPVAYTEQPTRDDSWAEEIVNIIGEQIGWVPLLVIILLGLNKTIRQKAMKIMKAIGS